MIYLHSCGLWCVRFPTVVLWAATYSEAVLLHLQWLSIPRAGQNKVIN